MQYVLYYVVRSLYLLLFLRSAQHSQQQRRQQQQNYQDPYPGRRKRGVGTRTKNALEPSQQIRMQISVSIPKISTIDNKNKEQKLSSSSESQFLTAKSMEFQINTQRQACPTRSPRRPKPECPARSHIGTWAIAFCMSRRTETDGRCMV